jgi:hypothetical protein
MKRSHFKGKYIPKNPEKYTGNIKQIIYRSSWERLFMVYCDKKENILEWSSEEVKIPYMHEGKNRTYYPDFWVLMLNKNDHYVEKLVEIKPHHQRTMKVNKAKWSAATKYCQDNKMEFLVMTEKELF